jgi:predicted nucleic acid-binding Zn ribbon protein
VQRADFICNECEYVTEIKYSLSDGPPEDVICEECEGKMRRVFTAALAIPEWFADDTHNAISKHMENAPRPSGRDKALY